MLSTAPLTSLGIWLLLALLGAAGHRRSTSPRARPGWPRRAVRHAPEEQRARALLRELLSDVELEQLRRAGYLEVPSPSVPHRVYRIPAAGGRVAVFDRGVKALELCVQPIDPLPASDVVLLHKLLIEGDERTYLDRANQFATRHRHA